MKKCNFAILITENYIINMAKEVIKENEAVISAVSKTEEFLEKNKKTIWIVIAAIAVIAAIGYVCYKFAYLPAQAEAQAQMYKAEASFRDGNYELALNGDGNVLGFSQIIDEYGTKAGKAVYLYAATCNLLKEEADPDAALALLGKYSTRDEIMAGRAEALKGDAWCNKAEYAKAAACFEKAARLSDNVFSAGYLLKAGQAYEALGENGKALAAYKTIKDKYTQSIEAYDIDKYITRLEVK